ncbi:MAG TPA: Rpn family recombination-promoting nuclease/putative transposase [Thermoanaerobaculia bacterium]|jgi:predicted transposase/invertase (TIGR01784 family)|nr:Rpn family recombination-promoting nuclease/putative transposase [Thermoanaerobaculia bacterium]
MARRKKTAPGHDPGYKRLFSHPKMVEELLRGFLDGDWVAQLDFSTLERVGNSFVSADLRERHSDLIWRLRLKGGEGGWVYLYLLLEFQSTSDPLMAVRLLTYVALLLEDVVRREPPKPGDRLPAVFPLVLYNGKGRWRTPLRLESLFAPVPKELRRYLPHLTYLLLDEQRLNLKRPELRQNLTAALFHIEANEEPTALPSLSRSLDELLPSGDLELRRTAQAWLSSVIQRKFPEAIIPEGANLKETPMLEETLVKWHDLIREEALREGQREMLLQQMTVRFGRLPQEVRSQVEQITSTAELRKLARKVLKAKSLQDMGFH